MKRKDILILLIPSLIVVILWVVFNIYHNYISSTIPTSINKQILSINPTFDTLTITSLKKRNAVNPTYTSSPKTESDEDGTASQTPTPTPTISISLPSSGSANLASGGGTLNP
jgi:hypothetical protein